MASQEKIQAIVKKEVLANPKMSYAEFNRKHPSVLRTTNVFLKLRYKYVSEAGRTNELPIRAGYTEPCSYSKTYRRKPSLKPLIRKEKTLYQSVWQVPVEEYEKDPFKAFESFIDALKIKVKMSFEIIKIEKRFDEKWIPYFEVRES